MQEKELTVGIDVTPILYNRGVSRYTTNLVIALGKQSQTQVRLFGSSFRANRQLHAQAAQLAQSAHIRKNPTILAFPPAFLARMWYGVGRLHIESLMSKVDVFHAWEELIPPTYTTPIVATIHDLAIFKFPELAHPQTRERHQAALKRLKAYNSHVIAVSEQTKRDLVELFSFDDDHVHVVPEALPNEIIVPKDKLLSMEELKKFGMIKPYFLWVGVNEPRKNLDRILQAWEPLSNDFDLVLVGHMNMQNVPTKPGLKVLTSVSSPELASLYAHAQALVYASLYEGFGLPIVEAFSYSCPVVTSSNSGMQEVADEAGFFVDPFDVASIEKGMRQAVEKGKTQQRLKLMRTSLKRYSWEKTATMTRAVYTKAVIDAKQK